MTRILHTYIHVCVYTFRAPGAHVRNHAVLAIFLSFFCSLNRSYIHISFVVSVFYGRRAGSGNFSDFTFQLWLLNKPV